MNRKGLAVVLLAASTAAGQEPVVLVRLIDAATVPAPMLISAKHTAAKILSSAGVRLRWGSSQCAAGAAAEVIDLRFRSYTPASYKPLAMAEALPYASSGVRINVFFDHVMEHLRNHRLSAGHILGHVMAHEIGHVLLRVNAHGDIGLMRPSWTSFDYNTMAFTNLEFTAGEARAIRSNLRTSYGLAAAVRSARP